MGKRSCRGVIICSSFSVEEPTASFAAAGRLLRLKAGKDWDGGSTICISIGVSTATERLGYPGAPEAEACGSISTGWEPSS